MQRAGIDVGAGSDICAGCGAVAAQRWFWMPASLKWRLAVNGLWAFFTSDLYFDKEIFAANVFGCRFEVIGFVLDHLLEVFFHHADDQLAVSQREREAEL